MFLDVGAHLGETLEIAIDPRYPIHQIFAFEPSSRCQSVLRGFRDGRIQIVQAGLGNATQKATLHASGSIGASIYADKPMDLAAYSEPEDVTILDVAEWLRSYVSPGDLVLMKLNCEGSEVDIIDRLVESGCASLVSSMFVHFDAEKIPSQRRRAVRARAQLEAAGIRFTTPPTWPSDWRPGFREWLETEVGDHRGSALHRLAYRLGLPFPRRSAGLLWARRLLPGPVLRTALRLRRKLWGRTGKGTPLDSGSSPRGNHQA